MRGKLMTKYFFDTYALVELYKGSPTYAKYKEEVKILLNKLNIQEFIYFLIREGKTSEIEESFRLLGKFNVEYDNEILIKAAEMKFKYKDERLSYVDCIGYYLAKKHKVKFLTGDSKFEDKENVEFVR